MRRSAGRLVPLARQHVLALLRADLPPDLLPAVKVGAYTPGLLSQLPFISVSVTLASRGSVGLGATVGLKRAVVDGALTDIGAIEGEAGACQFTLSLWATVRPQLAAVGNAVEELAWVQRENTWEAPVGTLNRTTFLRCELTSAAPMLATPLVLAPSLTVRNNNLPMFGAPDAATPILGRANVGDQFELLGRNDAATFVQGCCLNGQPVWFQAQFVELSLPMVAIPVSQPAADRDVLAPLDAPADRDVIDPGVAIVATADTPPLTVWRQDLAFSAYLEASREPLVSAGDRITEIRIIRHIQGDEGGVDIERTRVFADHAEVVGDFPP